jgi:hypothetical protein
MYVKRDAYIPYINCIRIGRDRSPSLRHDILRVWRHVRTDRPNNAPLGFH